MSSFTLDDLRSLINSGPALAVESVSVPEFGEGKQIHLAELNALEVEERLGIPWSERREQQGSNAGFRAFAVAACWCNSPSRDFVALTAKEIGDSSSLLSKLGRGVIERLYEVVARLNGLREEDDDKKK